MSETANPDTNSSRSGQAVTAPATGRNTSNTSSKTDTKPPATDEEKANEEKAEGKQSKRLWTRPWFIIGAGVVVVVGGILGLRWWRYASTHAGTNDAQLQGHKYEVSSQVNGAVQKVAIVQNEVVKPGQLLVQLDPRDYQAQVEQAKAALEVAQKKAASAKDTVAQSNASTAAQITTAQGSVNNSQAAISNARAGLTTAEEGVPVAQAELAKAIATVEEARVNYERYQDLFVGGAVAAQARDAYRKTYEVAQAQVVEDQKQVKQAQAKVSEARANIAEAQAGLLSSEGNLQQARTGNLQSSADSSDYAAALAQVKQARASLAAAQLQLSYTTIEAPEAGVIGNKSVEPGDRIESGQPLMAVVGQEIWVMANFKETQLDRIRPRQPVSISIDALGGQKLTGIVQSLAPASGSEFALLPPDNATGNFTKVVQRVPVKILLDIVSLDQYRARLAPGMSVVVSIDTSQLKSDPGNQQSRSNKL